GAELRAVLEDEGCGPGDVRGGHRGPGQVHVVVVEGEAEAAALGTGGHDVDPRRGDLRLDRVVAGPRAAAGGLGDALVPVHRADGQGEVRRGGRGDRAVPGAVVAGGHHEQRAVLLGERVDGRARGGGPVGVVAACAQAHVDDVRAVLRGPLHARDDAAGGAGPDVVEHLDVEQLGAGGHAHVTASGGRAAAGDGRGHVRAVTVAVVHGVAGAEV